MSRRLRKNSGLAHRWLFQVIKVVRELTSLGLKEAKELVDNPPKNVAEAVPKEKAEQIKAKLEEVGATCELA